MSDHGCEMTASSPAARQGSSPPHAPAFTAYADINAVTEAINQGNVTGTSPT